MAKKILLLIILISSNAFSQKVEGIIYDSEGSLNYVLVWNKSLNIYTRSNENGSFKIRAKTGDSLIFSSAEYITQLLVVQEKKIEGKIVIELNKKINELDVVNLTALNEEINIEKSNKDMHSILRKDMEKHWYLYKNMSNSRGNLFSLIELLIKNNRNKKSDENHYDKLQYVDFQNIFEDNSIPNNRFITEDLKIPVKFKNLFIDYLDSLKWNKNLADDKNRLKLIEMLYVSSNKYLEVLRNSNEY
ncbi:hypothetical protein [Christiangramia sp. LLG6405-1]|uniref:hypothetical protein n=1 Tax=Christiangramia sp. LLG6405-1 TaxID=3160832 RepID=UPI003867C2B1